MNATPPSQSRGIWFGWYLPAAAAILYMFYGTLMIYGFTVFLPPILEETGWSRAEAGGVYGLVAAEAGIMAPIYGLLVNRYGSRIPMIVGSAMGGVGIIWMSQLNSLAELYLSFGLAGAGFAVYYFGPIAAISNWFKRNRNLAMGIAISGVVLSGLLLPLLQWGVETHGWRQTLLVGGIAGLLCCVPLSCLFRFTPEPYGHTVDGVPAVNEEASENESEEGHKAITLSVLITIPVFWYLVLNNVAFNLGFSALLPHVGVFFKDVGIVESVTALAFTFYGVASIISRVGSGFLGDRFNKATLLMLSFLFQAIGVLGLSFASEAWHLGFMVLLVAPGAAGFLVVTPALVADVFGPRAVPLVFSFALFPGMIIGMFGPGIAGWMADTLGSYQPAFWAGAVMAFIGVPVSIALKKQMAGDPLAGSSLSRAVTD